MNIRNFMQLIQMSKGNPQQFLSTMSEQYAQNPMMTNLLNLAKNNDANGIEQIARNMMKEKGLDFDKEFENFRKTYHL